MDQSDENIWVDVVFLHPPYRRFSYRVPEALRSDLVPGCRVMVPFGVRKTVGFVVDRIDFPSVSDVKDIEDLLDPYPMITDDLLKLLRWMAEYYLCPLGDAIRAALPSGILQEEKITAQRTGSPLPGPGTLTGLQSKILDLLENGRPLSLSGLRRSVGSTRIHHELIRLQDIGLVRVERIFKTVRSRARTEARIVLKPGWDEERIAGLARRAKGQARVIRDLVQAGGQLPRNRLPARTEILDELKAKDWIEIIEEPAFRDFYDGIKGETPVPFVLTDEQNQALTAVDESIARPDFRVFLLHGVTGSGKTQVYIEAIRKILAVGKTAIVLVPEISLTPQAVQRYRGAFGDRIAVLHSGMSAGERADSWRALRERSLSIALGPRSAVFAPLSNLGLIVVDEEHEASYKQEDPSPRYHGRDVAVVRAKLNHCPVILGSATPSLESFHNCLENKYTLLRLTTRVDNVPMPKVLVVDQNNAGFSDMVLSGVLKEKIEERLKQREQIIILQNRRGHSTFLRCGTCGWIDRCTRCSITLTFHRKDHRLKCHYCDFSKRPADVCPSCGSATFQYRGIGTQKVEETLVSLFPDVRLFRMDSDTMRRKGEHGRIVIGFEKGEADVLLGTQMVAKGHDFPQVTLVGVVSADTGLHFPDFRSGERAFQLLVQAAGRAGRRDKQGEVVIQTRSPDHPVLRFSVDQDYDGFYQYESAQRKDLDYPPWGRLILVRFQGIREKAVEEAAEDFARFIPPLPACQVLGPVPSPLSRIKGMHRFQMILRTSKDLDPSGRILRDQVQKAHSLWTSKTRHRDVRMAVDVDPIDLM